MPVSAILFVNLRGDVVISRFYRNNVSNAAVDSFRRLITTKKIDNLSPVICIDDCSFLASRHSDMYVVAVTKINANAAMIFQFLFKLVDLFRAYFGGKFDHESVQNNFVLMYELLDETMDHGYPQLTAIEILSGYIKNGDVKDKSMKDNTMAQDLNMTSQITGQVDWRQPGKHKYKKNEVFIDVLEAVNLMVSVKGQILRADVSGKVIMKAFLSGMPECKFGVNDKLGTEDGKTKVRRKQTRIAIDDLSFHRCVKLTQFDIDRTISFIPPDGEFELMKYRITQNVNLPFQLTQISVVEHGKGRVEYDVTVKGNFSNQLFGTNVLITVPTPSNAAKSQIHVGMGKAKYNPAKNAIVWKIKKFPGATSYSMRADVKLVASINDKGWSKPPITVSFQVPMFTSSGMKVLFLRIFEQSNYDTTKWVRYMTRAGQYQIRI
eukprot:gb/GEZN01008253.1/.p1 GENE.gb/GEZN01008253.1/~~gb/GEZN01008253.1/.p1  ORF type:complete len:435 (+),score=59.31 gb/GEZN01008253.1/:23-1327(+)